VEDFTHYSDEELAFQYRTSGRSKDLLEELLRRHYDWIMRASIAKLGSVSAAEDATQLVLTELARSIPRFKGKSKFSTWAYTIWRRTLFRHQRRLLKRREQEAPIEAAESELKSADTPERKALARELRGELLSSLRQLPEKQQQAVYFHYYEDLSLEQIGERLGCSAQTVKTHLKRGRDTLREILKQEKNDG